MWYQHDVRLFAMFAATALLVTACGGQSRPSSSVTSVPSATSAAVNPARIDRARDALPDGYEVSDVAGRIAPYAQWGLAAGWTAEPAQCGPLADPVPAPASAKGWSASGPGGIVYAVVAGSSQQASFDAAVIAECAQWTVTGGRTTAAVSATAGPSIDGAATVALSIAATTVVEGGTETHSHADTVSAYLNDYVASVTVMTDPGAPNPQLGRDFASTLLVESVTQLRG